MVDVSSSSSEHVNVHAAKTQFSKLLARVEGGEEIVIARAGRPVAKLVPIKERTWRDFIGCMQGQFTIPENFNDPDPEIEEMFGMR